MRRSVAGWPALLSLVALTAWGPALAQTGPRVAPASSPGTTVAPATAPATAPAPSVPTPTPTTQPVAAVGSGTVASAAPTPPAAPAPRAAAPAAAALLPPPVEPESWVSLRRGSFFVALPAWERVWLGTQSSLPLDRDRLKLARGVLGETRLRLTPQAQWRRLTLVGQADLATGAAFGTPDLDLIDPPYRDFAVVDPRYLYLEWRGRASLVRVGQQGSHWGMGLLANDGDHDPGFGDLRFGTARGGDLVLRLLIAGYPLASRASALRGLELAAALDLVSRDGKATLADDDIAFQGVVAARLRGGPGREVGLYLVVRTQETADDRRLKVMAVDLAASWDRRWGRTVGYLAAEAAVIFGTATLAPAVDHQEHDVLQAGGALRAGLRHGRLEAAVDLGYASGDRNPYDDTLHTFTFSADHRVGLLLFRRLLAYQTARSAARASDPDLVGVPPAGVDLLPTEGGVAGAAYLMPVARYAPLPWLEALGGPLLAFATEPLVDPYNTRLDGGVGTNYLGGPARRFLGVELDAAVRAHRRFGVVDAGLGLEAGVLWPGAAFEDATGHGIGTIVGGQLRLDARF